MLRVAWMFLYVGEYFATNHPFPSPLPHLFQTLSHPPYITPRTCCWSQILAIPAQNQVQHRLASPWYPVWSPSLLSSWKSSPVLWGSSSCTWWGPFRLGPFSEWREAASSPRRLVLYGSLHHHSQKRCLLSVQQKIADKLKIFHAQYGSQLPVKLFQTTEAKKTLFFCTLHTILHHHKSRDPKQNSFIKDTYVTLTLYQKSMLTKFDLHVTIKHN